MESNAATRALILLRDLYRKADVNPMLQRIVKAGLESDVTSLEWWEKSLDETRAEFAQGLYRDGVEL